jgi:hypothetical protein
LFYKKVPAIFLNYVKVLGKSYFPFSPVLLLSLFYLFPGASLSLPWPAPISSLLPSFARLEIHAAAGVRAAAAPRRRARGGGRGRARLSARVSSAGAAACAGAERARASAGERARRPAARGGGSAQRGAVARGASEH